MKRTSTIRTNFVWEIETNALDVCDGFDVVVPREGLDLDDHGGIIVRFIEILSQIRKSKSMNRKWTPKSPFPRRRKLGLPPITQIPGELVPA